MQLRKDIDSRKLLKKQEQMSNISDVPFSVKTFLYIITCLFALTAAIPLILTFAVSITENEALAVNGYSLIPEKVSIDAYTYIIKNGRAIWRAYGVTALVTVLGTIIGLWMKTMFAYVVSRKYFPWRNSFTFFVYFTMLFNGGMVPTYMVVTQILNLKDTLGALIFPICVTVSHILILKTYMSTSIPDAVVESAKMDGAGEFLCYRKIVLPMAVPSIMTIALFMVVLYWNDWYQGFLYILNNDKLVSIQLYLKRIENDLQFFSQEAQNGMNAVEMENFRKSMPTESFRMAMVMVAVIPLLIAYPFFQKYFIKGMTVGAVKG